ncbi:hypothetical protein L226DRAFT_16272 [Lentinus tigrinus ALCF2SS1-7]|uniref:uncharacterized protein n=1 Tax=Lentinus tigrinus ALCF2SS1-7 TaxID=1328758 RepID=UPI001165F1CE|nr:hypothetical protein L226DRAFT_16272 [Lentinus tigrinus ALCF2SS1-7]
MRTGTRERRTHAEDDTETRGGKGKKRTRQGRRRTVAEGMGRGKGEGTSYRRRREESVPGRLRAQLEGGITSWPEAPECDRNSNELHPRRGERVGACARDARTWAAQVTAASAGTWPSLPPALARSAALLVFARRAPSSEKGTPALRVAYPTPPLNFSMTLSPASDLPAIRTDAWGRFPTRPISGISPALSPRLSHPSPLVLQPLSRLPRARSKPSASNVVFICPLPLQKRPRPSVRPPSLSQATPSGSAHPPPASVPAPRPVTPASSPIRPSSLRPFLSPIAAPFHMHSLPFFSRPPLRSPLVARQSTPPSPCPLTLVYLDAVHLAPPPASSSDSLTALGTDCASVLRYPTSSATFRVPSRLCDSPGRAGAMSSFLPLFPTPIPGLFAAKCSHRHGPSPAGDSSSCTSLP